MISLKMNKFSRHFPYWEWNMLPQASGLDLFRRSSRVIYSCWFIRILLLYLVWVLTQKERKHDENLSEMNWKSSEQKRNLTNRDATPKYNVTTLSMWMDPSCKRRRNKLLPSCVGGLDVRRYWNWSSFPSIRLIGFRLN